MKAIATDKAPAAIGPYSQGFTVGNIAVVSGQTPVVPETKEIPEGIEAQANSEKQPPKSQKGQWAICPVCGKRFQKKEAGQTYDSITCANKARRSTPRYGG